MENHKAAVANWPHFILGDETQMDDPEGALVATAARYMKEAG